MEPEENKNEAAENQEPQAEQQPTQDVPADALSRTPDELEEAQAVNDVVEDEAKSSTEQPDEKKVSPLKRFFRKVNLYFLIFLLLVVVAGAIAIISYLNSQNTTEPGIANQTLTQDALKQLANTDATIGNTSQTLTIQGNTVVKGQSLMQGSVSIAGSLQTGGSIRGPSLTISGETSLGETQINSLQVAQNTAIQGDTTVRDLNVAGAASFSGALTASKITVSQLVMSGNAILQIPNHLSFTGPSPSRDYIGSNVLGSGGSVSVNGSDTSGSINLNSGNSANGTGCIVRINFKQSYAKQPRVLVSPVNAAAGKLNYYVEKDTNGFRLCTTNSPDDNKTFAFDYFVAG